MEPIWHVSEVDFFWLLVVTNPRQHKLLILEALSLGKHVLVEKPINLHSLGKRRFAIRG